MQKLFDRAYTGVALVVVALLPLLTFPLASNVFEIPKLTLLVIGVGVLLLLKAISILISGKIDFKYSRMDLPLLTLAAVYGASAFFKTPNKMEALLSPGAAVFMVCAVLLFVLVNQMIHKKNLVYALLVSGGLYALISIVSKTGLVTVLPFLPSYAKSEFFTPGGGYLPSAIFLLMILPLAVVSIFFSKTFKLQILGVVSGILVLFGLGLSLYQLTPGKPTTLKLPSYFVSWAVTTDALTSSPLFGMGPGNYLTAFNRFRPLQYNTTDLWNIKYMTATNFLFTLVTETGLVGLCVMLFVALLLFRTLRDRIKSERNETSFIGLAGLVSTLIGVVMMLFLPLAYFVMTIFFVFLALTVKTKSLHLNLEFGRGESGQPNKFPAFLVGVPIILVVLYVYFVSAKYLYAETIYAGALTAVSENKAQTAFEKMTSAVNANPRVDRYRISMSQLSFVLANAIASKSAGQDAQTITDQDRQQITQLIQLSIQEAKAAVALNPLRSGNWEVLGRTYRSIIPLAKGADQFALQAYSQAIILDPHNPNLRVVLGELLYTAKQFDQAQRVLELAVSSKPDHANARFNLAYVLSNQNKLDEAIAQMKIVLTLVKTGTNDEKIAQESLKTLEEKKKLQDEKSGENLTPPQDQVEQVITPPVELSQDDQPPPAPNLDETPTATSAAKPTATSNPSPISSPSPAN